MTVGLPESLRPQLRALIAGVVSLAQDVYRRKLTVVANEIRAADGLTPARSLTVGDQWPDIVSVLESKLAGQPELLDLLLVELANIRPSATDRPKIASVRTA